MAVLARAMVPHRRISGYPQSISQEGERGMDPVMLARWHFGLTSTYHYFFVPLTLGLTLVVAIMQTLWMVTDDIAYKRMTKFWGKLMLINFAIGVVTGLVMEFQFGMNWSEFSRYVGDIFGAPLAIEALLAFFLESTFLGLWIFGWDRLSRRVHLATIWLVAIGSNLSAIWILIANSFMQQPLGYVLRNGRAEMESFWALTTNPHLFVQFPHVFTSALATAAFLIMGISAYHLRKSANDTDRDVFSRSFRLGAILAVTATVATMIVGHTQAQYMIGIQPMKMAAAEALWESADPAPMSLFTVGDEQARQDLFAVKVPGLLSFLAYNRFSGEVKGIRELQTEYEARYGPGDYVPSVIWAYWSFRLMVGAGTLMFVLALYGLVLALRDRIQSSRRFLYLLIPAILLPHLANATGWLFTEMGRQPWIVFGLQKTADGVSPNVTPAEVLFTLIGFTLIYAALIVAEVYLMTKTARAGASGINVSDETPAHA
jgi:cytochrome bd ubiquinol oxidase subunit I